MTRMSRLGATGHRLRRARRGRDLGFTVLELVVVLAMLGVLLGIGIPTFINYLNSSSNATAQANLKTALMVADTYYQVQQHTYTGLCTNANCSGGPNGGFQAVAGNSLSAVPGNVESRSPTEISVWVSPNGSEVVLAALASGPKNCWVIISAKGNNTVLGYRAPVLLYIREKRGKTQKQPTCHAGAPVYLSKVPDVTEKSLNDFPPGN